MSATNEKTFDPVAHSPPVSVSVPLSSQLDYISASPGSNDSRHSSDQSSHRVYPLNLVDSFERNRAETALQCSRKSRRLVNSTSTPSPRPRGWLTPFPNPGRGVKLQAVHVGALAGQVLSPKTWRCTIGGNGHLAEESLDLLPGTHSDSALPPGFVQSRPGGGEHARNDGKIWVGIWRGRANRLGRAGRQLTYWLAVNNSGRRGRGCGNPLKKLSPTGGGGWPNATCSWRTHIRAILPLFDNLVL